MEDPDTILLRCRELRREMVGRLSRRAVSLALLLKDQQDHLPSRVKRGREVVATNPGMKPYLDRLREAEVCCDEVLGDLVSRYTSADVAKALFGAEEL